MSICTITTTDSKQQIYALSLPFSKTSKIAKWVEVEEIPRVSLCGALETKHWCYLAEKKYQRSSLTKYSVNSPCGQQMPASRIDSILSFGTVNDATSTPSFWLTPNRKADCMLLSLCSWPGAPTDSHTHKYSMFHFLDSFGVSKFNSNRQPSSAPS